MFLALCREGALARLPSGAVCVILSRESGAVFVRRFGDGEEFSIHPRYLRHVPGANKLEGVHIVDL